MPAGFRRHLVGKALGNVCYPAVIEIRSVDRLHGHFLKPTG